MFGVPLLMALILHILVVSSICRLSIYLSIYRYIYLTSSLPSERPLLFSVLLPFGDLSDAAIVGRIDDKKDTDTVDTVGVVDRGTVFLRAQGDLKPARKKKAKRDKSDEKVVGEENKFKGFTPKIAISKLKVLAIYIIMDIFYVYCDMLTFGLVWWCRRPKVVSKRWLMIILIFMPRKYLRVPISLPYHMIPSSILLNETLSILAR
jgi:hypothetical protein